eukprot:jgi/Mesvir1/2877/Mv13956-RA.1
MRSLDFPRRAGALAEMFDFWEKRNSPWTLPEDLKAVYGMSDGLSLSWTVMLDGEEKVLGNMHLNSIANMKPLPLHNVPRDDPEEAVTCVLPLINALCDEQDAMLLKEEVYQNCQSGEPWRSSRLMAFDLDVSCGCGRTALVFSAALGPQVWFQDLSCSWNFVASSFASYFRVLQLNLGLPNWQYAFTPVGLDPISRQWFRLMCPHRLEGAGHPSGAQGHPNGQRVASANTTAYPFAKRAAKPKKKNRG